MRTLFFLWCLFVSFTPSKSFASSLNVALQKLENHIQQQIKERKVVGCAVAVLDHDKVVFLKTYGVKKLKENEKIDPNTVFELGSLSKPLTSTLVAILKKRGSINLDASAQLFFSCLKPTTKIRNILSHTTGYKRAGWNYRIEHGVLRPQLLEKLSKTVQDKPGQFFDYHNFVYSLIEFIIEQSQKMPFKDVVYQKLFTPLGMSRATVGYTDFEKQSNKAWPHEREKNDAFKPSNSYSKLYHAAVASAGGMNASIWDMIPFLKLQLVGDSELVDSRDLDMFHSPVIEAQDAFGWFRNMMKGDLKSYYGLGWRILENNGKRLVFHGGWVKGFQNYLGFLPNRKVGIVILHNAESNFAAKTGTLFLNEWVT